MSTRVKSGSIISVPSKLVVISGLNGERVRDALTRLKSELTNAALQLDDIISIQLFMRDLTKVNAEFEQFFRESKKLPTRTCVEIDLPTNVPFLLNVTAIREKSEQKRQVFVIRIFLRN